MGLIVKNLKTVLERMARSEAKVEKGSLDALRKAAARVTQGAKDRAPVDDGFLEDSITTKEVQERTSLGRFGQITIEVGVDSAKLRATSGNPHDYSVEMHEDVYELGPKSQAKDDSSSVGVGPKFLERAWQADEADIRREMQEAIKRSLNQ